MKSRKLVCFCLLGLSLLFSCGKQTAKIDPYDPGKIELKSVAARVSNERHTGLYVEGLALNRQSELKPVDPSAVKFIRLDTTHKIIEIVPGVKFGT